MESIKRLRNGCNKALKRVNKHIQLEILSVALMMAFFAVSTKMYDGVIRKKHNSVIDFVRTTSTTRALGSLYSGKAKRFSDEAYKRVEIYMASKGKDVEVEEYSVKPGLLFFDDIQEDPKDWRNRGLCSYYDLKSVKLIPRKGKNKGN